MIVLTLITSGCVTGGRGVERAVIRAKDRVAPALVHVRPVKEIFRRGKRTEVSVIGSGFIITPDGYVVTNDHVAGKSKYVLCVLSNKEEVEAEVVGVDPFTDIAVLKLKTEATNLPYVKMGTSATLEAGQMVIALGSPHGLARSVSSGIVSVTDRNLESMGRSSALYNNWIQTDAAINPGNSGGPLVNLRGEVIGINTRKLTGADNVGFAIPIDIAKEVIEEIIRTGRVARSSIGVVFQEMTRITDDPMQRGVVIADVDPLSPAHDAQLRPGDILLEIDGVATDARFVEDLPAVRKRIADVQAGNDVTLTIRRGDSVIQVVVATVDKGARTGKEIEFEDWGFTVSELTQAVIRRAQLLDRRGVMVSGVQVGSKSSQARLEPGDIILKVDEDKVEDLDSFQSIYDERVASQKRLVLFTLKRRGLTMFKLLQQDGRSDDES